MHSRLASGLEAVHPEPWFTDLWLRFGFLTLWISDAGGTLRLDVEKLFGAAQVKQCFPHKKEPLRQEPFKQEIVPVRPSDLYRAN